MLRRALHTVVETPEYRRRVGRLLNEQQRKRLIDYLATTPDAGDVMPQTGGVRKFRWAAGGKGKSGGVRVITFYSGPPVPVFLLTVFGKGEKANLTKGERNQLRDLVRALAAEYRSGVKRDVKGR